MLHQILYSSVAAEAMDCDALRALLGDSRKRNGELDVTGVLIYNAPTREFFQVLEGEEEVLQHLMRKIERDGRHHNVLIEVEGEIEARSFGDWAMGFLYCDSEGATAWPGYSAVLQEGVRALHLTGRSSTGLRMFELIASSLAAAESAQ